MDNSIIELFKKKKIKVISSYAKILEEMITLEENTLWQKPKEFEPICDGVVAYFVDKYYFDNNINRNNPVEYLNDNINAVLIAIMDYYKNKNQSNIVGLKKNETFLLSTIICVASFVDIASNVVDGDYNLMKNNLNKLLKHLSKTEILKIYYHNKIILNKLFTEIRKNIKNEKKFFNYFQSNAYHNEYQIISEDPLYYKVRFIYKVDGLEGKNNKLVKNFHHEYLKDYLKICYELLEVLLMKEYIMNKEVNTYLIPILDINDENLEILNHPLIKDNVKLLVPFEKYDAKIDTKLAVIYVYNGENKENLNNVKDCEILVKESFIEKNKDAIEELKKQNIKLVVEKLGKRVKEKTICEIKEEIL